MRATGIVAFAAVMALNSTNALAAADTNAWTDIMNSKKFTACIVPAYQPYSWKDKEGKWEGFAAEMAKDLAKSLRVDIAFVETSFKTVILDIQSGKCHAFFGFNATPERALAIDFAGPLYTLGFAALDRQGWQPPGNRWSDLNDPAVRVCYTMGNSSEQQIKRFAPNAKRIALEKADECVLALQAGRADRYIDGIMGIIGARQKNATLGKIQIMTPSYALPSYAGVRLDDGRFQKFLQKWSEYNRGNGNIQEWITKSMENAGIDVGALPPEVQF